MAEDTRLVTAIEYSSTPSLLREEKEVRTLARVPVGDNVWCEKGRFSDAPWREGVKRWR